MTRRADVKRQTAETSILVSMDLDGTGKADIRTGIGFFDHMLHQIARHGQIDLTVMCDGDLHIDGHHSVEDIGICLGMAFAEALGNGAGIRRYGHIILPMDETLILCAVDLSGRAHLEYGLEIPTEKVGTFDTELTEEFLIAFVRKANMTLHVKQLSGRNSSAVLRFPGTRPLSAKSCRRTSAMMDMVPSSPMRTVKSVGEKGSACTISS